MSEVIVLKRGMSNKKAIYAQYPIVEVKKLYDYRLKYQLLCQEFEYLLEENQKLKEKLSQLTIYEMNK